jgi:hypothetical protein
MCQRRKHFRWDGSYLRLSRCILPSVDFLPFAGRADVAAAQKTEPSLHSCAACRAQYTFLRRRRGSTTLGFACSVMPIPPDSRAGGRCIALSEAPPRTWSTCVTCATGANQPDRSTGMLQFLLPRLNADPEGCRVAVYRGIFGPRSDLL